MQAPPIEEVRSLEPGHNGARGFAPSPGLNSERYNSHMYPPPGLVRDVHVLGMSINVGVTWTPRDRRS